MAKSKFFRVAVEGFTASDGRKIEATWIDQMAEGYNPATYTARINMEHIKGYSPEPPFNAYGDVSAVRAQTDDIVIDGKTEKRRALYAQIAPNDQLLAINAKGQKTFTSVEIALDFANTKKAGLVGLAVTDNPASLGTEALSFSGLKPMFDARKSHPDNLFTASVEAAIEIERDAADPTGIIGAINAGFSAIAAKFTGKGDDKPKDEPKTPPANDNVFDPAAFATQLGSELSKTLGEFAKASDAKVDKVSADLAALTAKLAGTEQPGFNRAPAPGGAGGIHTDC